MSVDALARRHDAAVPAEVSATPFASVATGGTLTVALRFPNQPFGASTSRSSFTTSAPSLLSHLFGASI